MTTKSRGEYLIDGATVLGLSALGVLMVLLAYGAVWALGVVATRLVAPSAVPALPHTTDGDLSVGGAFTDPWLTLVGVGAIIVVCLLAYLVGVARHVLPARLSRWWAYLAGRGGNQR